MSERLHHNRVRGLLRRNGYRVGSWSQSGRISGMSNFSGGNIEVSQGYDDVVVSVSSERLYDDVNSSELVDLFEVNGWSVQELGSGLSVSN